MTEAQWYFMDQHGQRGGPANTAALAAALDAGEIGRDSLVWHEQMSDWKPLHEVADSLGLVVPAAAQTPPPLPAASMPASAHQSEAPVAGNDIVYAGFWRRYAALFLDQLILGTAFYLILMVFMVVVAIVVAGGAAAGLDSDEPPTWIFAAYFGAMLLYYVAAGFYYSLQESSVHQATLGKRALGIKVVDLQGRRLSLRAAVGRWFATALSYFTLYIGFLMAAFTQRKQALHDIVANTLVVDRWAYTATPERQQRELSGCLIAVIVAFMLMIGVAVLGILAAIAIPAYQDYTVRAQVSMAMSEAAPLKLTVHEFQAQNDACPVNGEGGIKQASDYVSPFVASIDVGEMEDTGGCGIQLTLRNLPATGEDGQRLWLELDPASGNWQCSSEIANKYLPIHCRG